MKRYGSLIGLRPEALDEYGRYHAAVRPEVLAMIRKCNIRNFSIFLKDGLLFSYFEYRKNYDADTAQMAADPKTQEWWKIMGPMQSPVENRRRASGGPAWRKASCRLAARHDDARPGLDTSQTSARTCSR
jgi:L-rhamnose mutarotase